MYNSIVCSTFIVKCSWNGLLEGRNRSCVWPFWCSELCSINQTVTVQRGSVLGVRGPEWFFSPFAHSGWVQFLESGEGCTNDSLSSPDCPLKYFEVRFGSWAELDSYWHAEDGFNDGRVELFQQLLWQVELPQLEKEVQPLLGLFHNGLNVIDPLQVLRNCGAQESERLHCSRSAVHDGEWGESGGFSWCPRSSPQFWAC